MSDSFKRACTRHCKSGRLRRNKKFLFQLARRATRDRRGDREAIHAAGGGSRGLAARAGQLKRYRAAVLKAACEGKLVPTEAELARQEGRTYETGAQLLERILTERFEKWNGKGKYKEPARPDTANLPPLAEGWVWATVEQIGSAIVDCPHSTPKWTSSGRICVRTTEFRVGYLDFGDVRFVSETTYRERISRLEPCAGDILYSREGGIMEICSFDGLLTAAVLGAAYYACIVKLQEL